MVQDLTTSFDEFETFAVSEMAKKPEKDDPLRPFTPKFWSNRYSTNSKTSYFEGNSQDFFSTPRRSGRIANQTKIDYNENIPKKSNYSQKQRRKSPKRCYASLKKRSSNTDRIKAIKTLFRKPNVGEIANKKPKSETRKKPLSKRRVKEGKMPNNLCISIPLHKIQTRLFTKSLTKASLKLFENGVDCFDTPKDNIQPEQNNVVEAFEVREPHSISTTIIEASYANKIPTENKFGNISEKSFSSIFKSFVDSSKENKKLKYNSTPKSFAHRERAIMQSAGTMFRKFSENNDNTPNVSQKLDENIVKEAFEGRQQSLDDFVEMSDETPNPVNLEKARNEDCQMMEISNGSHQYLEEELPKNREENEVLNKTHKSDRSIIKEASAEKDQPLDLTLIDASEKPWKPRKIDARNQSINTEENDEFIEDLTIMEVSNEIPSSKKAISNDTRNCSPDNVSIFELLKKNEQPKQNFNTARQLCTDESVKIQTLTISKVRNDKQITATTQALSIMSISDKTQKPENMNKKAFAEKDDLTIIEVSEELQNPTRINIRKNTPALEETFSDNDDDDVFIVENKSLRLNYKTGVFEKCPSQSSNSTVLDENENDYQDDERARNERKIIEELKSLIEECPLDGSEKSYVENLTETSNNFDENPAETIVNEVEIYEESDDSEIVVIEEPFLDNAENLDEEKNEEGFNKSSDDDVDMHFPQGHHPLYQQEYIELIHQYNYFPFQNYQYPRYEYPIEENKFDHRPNNLSFLSQRYGEFQIPQIHLDYNNYRMQFHAHGNLEEDDKLKITEYYDSEEEENEKELDTDQNEPHNKTLQVQPRSNLDQKQLPILSQPPPIQCSSEQHYLPSMQNIINPQTTQLYLQSQNQIGHICENSLHSQGYSQNNSELTNNNQWQIVSIQNCGQTSSEQRDSQLYENTCSIHVFPHTNDENQSESQIVQRLHQVPTQNIHPQQSQTEIIERQQPLDHLQQGHQPLSQIADFVKNNCHIHDVKFGKIKILNGRMDNMEPMEISPEEATSVL